MKKLIFKKLNQDILSFFVTSIILMGLIVWTLQAVNYFDLVAEDGHGLKIYFYFTIIMEPISFLSIYLSWIVFGSGVIYYYSTVESQRIYTALEPNFSR